MSNFKRIFQMLIFLLLSLSQINLFYLSAVTYPDPPRNLLLTNIGANTIKLTWDLPTSDGGSPITGYLVEYIRPINVGGDGIWKILNASVSSLDYTYVSGALPYGYRVSTINSFGVSLPSNYVGSVRGTAEVPRLPAETEAIRLSGTEMNLTWVKPNYDGGLPILGYRIEYWEAARLSTKIILNTTDPEILNYSINNLDPVKSYEYKIAAYNRVGIGDFSEVKVVDRLPSNVARVKFIVYDGGTRIKDATVTIGGKDYSTDYNGFAITDNIALGTHSYTVSMSGYDNKVGQITLNQENELKILLVELGDSSEASLNITFKIFMIDGVRRVKGDVHIDVNGVLTRLYSAKLIVEVEDPDGITYGPVEFRSNNMTDYDTYGVSFDLEVPDIGVSPKPGEWIVTISSPPEGASPGGTATQTFVVEDLASTKKISDISIMSLDSLDDVYATRNTTIKIILFDSNIGWNEDNIYPATFRVAVHDPYGELYNSKEFTMSSDWKYIGYTFIPDIAGGWKIILSWDGNTEYQGDIHTYEFQVKSHAYIPGYPMESIAIALILIYVLYSKRPE